MGIWPIKETPNHKLDSLKRLSGYYNILEKIEAISSELFRLEVDKQRKYFSDLISTVEELAKFEASYLEKL